MRKVISAVKVLLFVIAICLTSTEVQAQLHKPTWFLMDDRSFSSFDMLNTRSGLAAIDDNGVRVITRYDSGTFNGIFAASGSVTSIIIVDQNIAYVAIKGDGIYQASNKWKDYSQLLVNPNPVLFSVFKTNILANLGGIFYYCDDGTSFHQAGGISPGDTITAAEVLSSQTAIAVTGKKIYRSHDGGRNWAVVMDNLDRTNSVYFDRTHSALYAGGLHLLKSLDSGLSWQELTSIFFTLTGAVEGTRDCSGNFYIAPDPKTHGAIYRSLDQGRFFQEAGVAIFSSIYLKKAVVLDRGSTFFWLDQSGLLGVVRDGIDSVVTDSVRDRISIQIDSGIRNSLCNNAPPTQFTVSLSFDQCTGIILDSLKQVTAKPSFSTKFSPGFLGDTSSTDIHFTYRASHAGFDTAHYRLRFHSQITQNVEQKYFDIIALGTSGSPDLTFAPNELDFAPTGLDSLRKLTVQIFNPGCDSLVIDTIYSTNPAIFIPDAGKFPVKIAPGKSVTQSVNFNPHLAGDYLESLGIETNIGNRFITLRGTGKALQVLVVQIPESPEEIKVYPNPANDLLTVTSVALLPKKIIIRDELGKEVRQFSTNELHTFICDLSGLPNGSYALDCGGRKFERIVIEH